MYNNDNATMYVFDEITFSDTGYDKRQYYFCRVTVSVYPYLLKGKRFFKDIELKIQFTTPPLVPSREGDLEFIRVIPFVYHIGGNFIYKWTIYVWEKTFFRMKKILRSEGGLKFYRMTIVEEHIDFLVFINILQIHVKACRHFIGVRPPNPYQHILSGIYVQIPRQRASFSSRSICGSPSTLNIGTRLKFSRFVTLKQFVSYLTLIQQDRFSIDRSIPPGIQKFKQTLWDCRRVNAAKFFNWTEPLLGKPAITKCLQEDNMKELVDAWVETSQSYCTPNVTQCQNAVAKVKTRCSNAVGRDLDEACSMI